MFSRVIRVPVMSVAKIRMKLFKNILVLILILAMLSTGLPLFSPQDADKNARLDLRDAVLNIQELARTIDNPTEFTTNIKKAISTLHAAAGLKTVIKPQRQTASGNGQVSLDLPALISTFTDSATLLDHRTITEQKLFYISNTISPDSPPPKLT